MLTGHERGRNAYGIDQCCMGAGQLLGSSGAALELMRLEHRVLQVGSGEHSELCSLQQVCRMNHCGLFTRDACKVLLTSILQGIPVHRIMVALTCDHAWDVQARDVGCCTKA